MRHNPSSPIGRQRFVFAAANMAAATALAMTMLGCGGKETAYPGVKLEGTVTIAGKPLADGLILFMPHEHGRGGGVKAVVKDGRYTADKVPTGKVRVTFNAMQETGRMIESASSPGKLLPERIDLIPAKYRSGVPLEVKEEQLKQDFNL